MVIILTLLLYGWIPVILLGWQIYVKADKTWITDYSNQFNFCYIMLGKPGHKNLVLYLSYHNCPI